MRPFVCAPLSGATAVTATLPTSSHRILTARTHFLPHEPRASRRCADSFCYPCWEARTFDALRGCKAHRDGHSCATSINAHADNLAARSGSNSTAPEVNTYTISIGDRRTIKYEYSSDGTKRGIEKGRAAVVLELGGGDYTQRLSVLDARDEERDHVRGGPRATRLPHPRVPTVGGVFMHSVSVPEGDGDTEKLSVAYVFRNTVNFALVNVDTGLHEYTRIERAAYATKRVKYKMRSSMLATEFWGAMYPPFHARHSQYAAEMAQRIRYRLETSPAWQLPQVS